MPKKQGRGRPKVGGRYDGVLFNIAELVCDRNFTARQAAKVLGEGGSHGIRWQRLYNLYLERSREFEIRVMESRLGRFGDGGQWRNLRQRAEWDLEDVPGFKEVAAELLPGVPIHRRTTEELKELFAEAERRFPDFPW